MNGILNFVRGVGSSASVAFVVTAAWWTIDWFLGTVRDVDHYVTVFCAAGGAAAIVMSHGRRYDRALFWSLRWLAAVLALFCASLFGFIVESVSVGPCAFVALLALGLIFFAMTRES